MKNQEQKPLLMYLYLLIVLLFIIGCTQEGLLGAEDEGEVTTHEKGNGHAIDAVEADEREGEALDDGGAEISTVEGSISSGASAEKMDEISEVRSTTELDEGGPEFSDTDMYLELEADVVDDDGAGGASADADGEIAPVSKIDDYLVSEPKEDLGSEVEPAVDYIEESEIAIEPAVIEVPQAGQLTAGEWNDLEHWDFWLGLGQHNGLAVAQQKWTLALQHRYSFKVTDSSLNPVIDATIALLCNDTEVWRMKTDNKGTAEAWRESVDVSDSCSASLTFNGGEYLFESVTGYSVGVNELTIPVEAVKPQAIDVQFVVDATGSMGDEINYLKSELQDVINRITNEKVNYSLQTSSVFYRDYSDTYITKPSDFGDPSGTINFIQSQSADGGGDFPEAVDEALEAGLSLSWREHAIARIIFLVLDAPPHDDEASGKRLREVVAQAAIKGIKIIPVTASGIDKDTEFLMRHLGITTNGTYTFITGHSGIGGGHIEPTIGDYEVEQLNDLMVRLVLEYTE